MFPHCMMFPQFLQERLPILKKNTTQFPTFQPLFNLRNIVMEKCRPSRTLRHPNEQPKPDPEENALRQKPKCVTSSVVDIGYVWDKYRMAFLY